MLVGSETFDVQKRCDLSYVIRYDAIVQEERNVMETYLERG